MSEADWIGICGFGFFVVAAISWAIWIASDRLAFLAVPLVIAGIGCVMAAASMQDAAEAARCCACCCR